MGGSNRRFSFVGSGYSYEPVGGLERLENVRIPIWSTKTITAQWFGPSGPLVDADLHRVGTDRLSGAVTNRQTTRCKTPSWPLAGKSTCWARSPREPRSGWPSPAFETSLGS